jgi:hypothetical protein
MNESVFNEKLIKQLEMVENYPAPDVFLSRLESGAINISKPELLSLFNDTCRLLDLASEHPAQQKNHERICKAKTKAKLMLGAIITLNE